MKREFLLLAQTYDPKKHSVSNWLMSEKLDGIRCFWDGGVSRGRFCSQIPWANTTKHSRFLNPPISTGLWTRYAQPIAAPNSWIDQLPAKPLDGELTTGRGRFQETMSIVRTTVSVNAEAWDDVNYAVFDSPNLHVVFADGQVTTPMFKKKFIGIGDWLKENGVPVTEEKPFYKVTAELAETDLGHHGLLLPQKPLPLGSAAVNEQLTEELTRVEEEGGEGLMLRSPISFWKPERYWGLLKVKRLQDAEGTVVGYKWARPTDLDRSVSGQQTDKLLGLMGSLRLKLDSGVEFDLSGFTNAERQMALLVDGVAYPEAALEHGREHPGEEVAIGFENPKFPRGSKITFRYRELTTDGVPKEARYFRKYEGV